MANKLEKNTVKSPTFALPFSGTADVAKLADALDLGSSAARHVGSTPSIRTIASHLSFNTTS